MNGGPSAKSRSFVAPRIEAVERPLNGFALWPVPGPGSGSAHRRAWLHQGIQPRQQHRVAYDGNGSLTADGSGKAYVYDAWDRLVRVTSGGRTQLREIMRITSSLHRGPSRSPWA